MRSGQVALALLVLLALTFRPTHQASGTDFDALIDSEAKSSVLHGGSGFETLEDTFPGTSCAKLDCYLGFLAISTNLKKFIRPYLTEGTSAKPNNGDTCLEFIKSLKKRMELLVETMRNDYFAIEAHREQWAPITTRLISSFQGLRPDHMEKIDSEEAFNCAIVLITFNADESTTFDAWMGIEKLSSRFVSNQWANFADWAIYVARPDVFTLPPQLFRPSLFSQAQRVFITQSVFGVITGNQSFKRNGFYRPITRKEGIINADGNYVFILMRNTNWDHEAVGELEDIIVYFLKSLDAIIAGSPNMIVFELAQIACTILARLANGENDELKAMMVYHLVTDSILGALRKIHLPKYDKNCAHIVVVSVYNADSKALSNALSKLNKPNMDFVIETMKIAKTIVKNAAQFEIVQGQLTGISHLVHSISLGDIDGVLKVIDSIFDSVAKLPSNDNLSTLSIRKSYLNLYSHTADLQSISNALFQYAHKMMLLFGTPGIALSDTAGLAKKFFKGLIRSKFIVYLLADSEMRLEHSMGVIFGIASLVQVMIMPILVENTKDYKISAQSLDEAICEIMESYISREALHQLFFSEYNQIASGKKVNNTNLSVMLVFAKIISIVDSAIKFATHAAVLLKAFLMNGGIASGDYFGNENLPASFELPQSIRLAVYMSIIPEWYANSHAKTKKEIASFKTFVNWLIKNNHVPRSMKMVLGATFK
jgi:hypothetical protein